eukprot:980555-Amphidinium_carterae.1
MPPPPATSQEDPVACEETGLLAIGSETPWPVVESLITPELQWGPYQVMQAPSLTRAGAIEHQVDVALAMHMGIVMMKPTESGTDSRGVTAMEALPSQLHNLFPGALNIPTGLRVVLCWAERCDVALGEAWEIRGVKMADLLIASEYWLSLASANME